MHPLDRYISMARTVMTVTVVNVVDLALVMGMDQETGEYACGGAVGHAKLRTGVQPALRDRRGV